MSASHTQPSPELFLETVSGYQRTEALKAAVELDIFTAVAEGRETARELAEACGAAERGVRILCDFLTILGFLTKEENRYRLTPDSAVFLDRRSPAYLGGALEFLLSPTLVDAFRELAEAVRRGGTTLPEGGTVSHENPVWVRFARAMAPLMRMPAQMLAQIVGEGAEGGRLNVLDIAAGHGVFGITLAEHNARAEIVALDWPNVLEVARENARAAGIEDRFSMLPGSAFDVDYGTGYDVILLTNFLHHFDPPTCETLLRKVHAALAEGGRAVTLEFVPDEDRISPPATAMFALTMLGSTPRGDAYTFSELQQMFANAGFSRSEFHRLPPTPQQAVVSYK
ncbi:MAG TPA: class I SAM-dependent methyltransferase [Pyrinomonadaceae bacterium]|jgi:2-polyprenyl-3-methyl-5-hydroxy-6-metoxy-1,4-benzoquinol methylase|nr:class I SAM-dependent methyltransferase [Pyrinomonadaceae bacterium]